MMHRLTDVNISTIEFFPDGRTVKLSFSNMFDGKVIATVKCASYFHFSTQNCMSGEDGFACFVGEVVCREITEEELDRLLRRHKFAFRGADEKFVVEPGLVYWIHVEGGEVVVDIGCKAVDLEGADWIPVV